MDQKSDIEKDLQKILNKEFKGHKIGLFSKLVINSRDVGEIIPSGTLVLFSVIQGSIKFATFNEERILKSYHIPLIISDFGRQKSITPTYIQWFLTRDYVRDFLINISYGSVITRIPRKSLDFLKIPLPKTPITKFDTVENEIQLITPFKNYIKRYYEQYNINFNQALFDTCAILAGAICEAILYQLLIDDNVSVNLLGDTVGLGTLIKYVELRKLDGELEFETQFFKEVNDLRNRAVHFSNFSRKQNENKTLISKDFCCFDNIIKQFGI